MGQSGPTCRCSCEGVPLKVSDDTSAWNARETTSWFSHAFACEPSQAQPENPLQILLPWHG